MLPLGKNKRTGFTGRILRRNLKVRMELKEIRRSIETKAPECGPLPKHYFHPTQKPLV